MIYYDAVIQCFPQYEAVSRATFCLYNEARCQVQATYSVVMYSPAGLPCCTA